MGDDVSVAMKGSETRQRRKVVHFVPHPEFDKPTFKNDIAVIRVSACECGCGCWLDKTYKTEMANIDRKDSIGTIKKCFFLVNSSSVRF